MPEKLKSIFTDTLWSIAGLVLMNVAAQFVVYPVWNRTLGSEAYGNIIYLTAIMNILAISVGSGVNYARMRQSANGVTLNKPYLVMMAGGSALSLLTLLALNVLGLLHMLPTEFCLFCLLTVATMWRYYADVEYRLNINYKGYFLYYVVIGIGYLAGIILFNATRLWPIALLPGELGGFLMVLWKGSIFRRDQNLGGEPLPPTMKLTLLLVGTNIISHLIFNGDRLVLQWFVGSAAVTVYYIASLFGKTMTLISTPLNGVLVGHLARYEGNLTRKMMHRVTVTAAVAMLVVTGACCLASVMVLPCLYPGEYVEVRRYLTLANAAQVVYFTGNVLTGSVLLRFTQVRNQMIVNVVHGVMFVVVCIPLAWKFGIDGFCLGLLSVNTTRLALCIMFGYKEI